MYEGKVQSVLRCTQCNKPFDKQSTLKRHGYYCRSRRAGSTTRTRSCISCARGKARCDNGRPGCSRCIAKGIECHYPASTPKGTAPRIQNGDDAPIERRKSVLSLVADSPSVGRNRREVSNDGDGILDKGIAISEPGFANLGAEYLDWNVPDFDFADFLNQQTNEETAQYPSSRSSSLIRHSTPSTNQKVQGQQAISSPHVSIPTLPTHTLRSLIQRPTLKAGAKRVGNLIFHTLKTYPLMMMRDNTLPPFIHPSLISSNVQNTDMEPLNNCISLMHMISSGVQGSRKLFWKNVRQECERLYEEYLKLNKWELLAALQALSIYVVVRLDEGEADHNNFDFLLLATVTVISKQLTNIDVTSNTESTLCNNTLDQSWKEWIFEESRRRLCVVYKVVNMLVYFEPATVCALPTDLIIAPLPAKKQIWDAGDEYSWKAESERESGVQTAFALATNGELVKVDEGPECCRDALLLHNPLDARTPSRSNANWEEWILGMDGLGGLVMLAASLTA